MYEHLSSVNKKDFFLFFIFIFFFSISYSQNIEIGGKVVDKVTGKTLQGVSIVVNKSIGTVSNDKGEFNLKVDEKLLKEKGITFSYISYKEKHIFYNTSQSYFIVDMALSEKQIPAVSVFGNTKSILQKAIEKIPENYPADQTIQTGIMRVYNVVGDTDYYYKSDAVVQIYFSRYGEQRQLQIKVLQNRQVVLQNPRSAYNQGNEKIRWVGGFYSIPDFVHEQKDFISLTKLNKYEYSQREKTFIYGRRVFVIDFRSITKKIEGTLYIDTATYAFVSADVIQYNIKELFFVPISVLKYSANYNLINGKWYINYAHTESRHVQKNENNNYIVDYSCTKIDTQNINSFSYNDVIQKKDENIKIRKETTAQNWILYDSVIGREEISGILSSLPQPEIDTTLKGKKISFYTGCINYLRNDNLRAIISIYQMPISVPDSKTSLARYGLCLGAQFRVYKNLFLDYNEINNFGIGGINNSMLELYLSNNFELNKIHRPVTISPIGGYNKVVSYIDKHKKTIYYNYALGIKAGIEWTHKKSIFIEGICINSFNKKNTEPSAQLNNIILSGGISLKL
ncbi:MAG: carboxypeptidase-like regulatory domain-containing protein [Bacteroidota bacterium]